MDARTPRWTPLRLAVLLSLGLAVQQSGNAQVAAELPPVVPPIPAAPVIVVEPVPQAVPPQATLPTTQRPAAVTPAQPGVGAAAAASAGGVAAQAPETPASALPTQQAGGPPATTPAMGGVENTLFNHHATTASPINATAAKNMQLAWSVPTEDFVSHTPLVDRERTYFADWGGNVYAVNNRDGSIVWKKKVAENVQRKWPWHGFAGTGAMSDELLFEASVEGMAYAIDKRTGNVVWKKDIAEDEHAGNLARMLYHDGLVYVGLSSVEELLTEMIPKFEVNFRGKVMALNAKTGELVWERSLVEPPHNGVAVWSSFALDPSTQTLYFTTSNNYTGEASTMSDALVAADAKTGRILWHRQVTMHDVWTKADPKGPDYAFGAGPQLFEATIDGRPRKLVGAGQKSGVFYVWDRVSGEPLWTFTLGYGHIGGGIHGEASITPDRILLWSNNAYPYKNPEQHPMDIAALHPATGKPFWLKPKVQPAVEISAGYVANDVYFVGSLDGQVRAYSTSSGDKLWTSGKHGSVASSLWVVGDTLMWGTGVPKMFGGNEGQPGVFAYRLGGEAPKSPQAPAAPAGSGTAK